MVPTILDDSVLCISYSTDFYGSNFYVSIILCTCLFIDWLICVVGATREWCVQSVLCIEEWSEDDFSSWAAQDICRAGMHHYWWWITESGLFVLSPIPGLLCQILSTKSGKGGPDTRPWCTHKSDMVKELLWFYLCLYIFHKPLL